MYTYHIKDYDWQVGHAKDYDWQVGHAIVPRMTINVNKRGDYIIPDMPLTCL